MTLDELRDRLPKPFQGWADTYGPAFLDMTAGEIQAWIELLIRGQAMLAYQTVLSRLPSTALLAEWTKINSEWQTANDRNAARISLQKEALFGVLKILLAVALAAAGL